jgi:hypothetical protein
MKVNYGERYLLNYPSTGLFFSLKTASKQENKPNEKTKPRRSPKMLSQLKPPSHQNLDIGSFEAAMVPAEGELNKEPL